MELTLKIPEELEEEVRSVSKAELSLLLLKLLKLEIERRARLLESKERFKKIVAKSKLTEEDAKELADKVSKAMHARLEAEGLV